MVNLDEIKERWRIITKSWDGWHKGAYTFVKTDVPALVAEVERLRELVHKGDGMANEINIISKDNRRLRAALKELITAADPHTNMSDVVLLDALSVARRALD